MGPLIDRAGYDKVRRHRQNAVEEGGRSVLGGPGPRAGEGADAGPTPVAPFGGMEQSGLGREGGIEGLPDFVVLQTVAQG